MHQYVQNTELHVFENLTMWYFTPSQALHQWASWGTMANSEDPDEVQRYAAFHQGLHRLLRLNKPSGTEIHYNLDTTTCDPFKYKMDNSILNVSICPEYRVTCI